MFVTIPQPERSLPPGAGEPALFVPGTAIRFPREPITDQYGVRFPVQLPGGEGGSPLKVEIVREARIELGDVSGLLAGA